MTLRIAVASSSLLALPLIESLRGIDGVDLCSFITTPDRPKGRSGTPTPNELASYLQSKGVELSKPADHHSLTEVVRKHDIHLVVVIAYGKLIKQDALTLPRYGWINLHFSLLPEYRGAAPVQRTLLDGKGRFGFTIFKLDEGMDTGPIYLQSEVHVRNEAPSTEILTLLADRAAQVLPEVIFNIVSGKPPQPQVGTGSLAPKIHKSETHLEVGSDVNLAFSQIRALTRKPGTWFNAMGKRCIITEAQLSDQSASPRHLAFKDGKLILGFQGGSIEIITIIPEGKREMAGSEFARGLRLSEGSQSDFEVS